MALLAVHLTPRGGRDEVVAVESDGRTILVRARVAAPPVDGKANVALERLLAATLGVPRSRVRVVDGTTARRKRVEIEGLTDAEARRRLGAPP